MTEKTLGQIAYESCFVIAPWSALHQDAKDNHEARAQAVAKAVREQCAQVLRAGLNAYLDNEPSEFTNGWNSGIRYGLGRISGLNNEVKP